MTKRRESRGLAIALGAFLLTAAVGIVSPGVASAVDFTPPTCSVGVSGSTVQLTFGDAGSGLGSISTQESVNAMVTIPSFTPGSTNELVTASAVAAGQATVRVKATDVDGNSIDCGRITFNSEALTQGGKLSDALTGIQQTQSTLKFFNGTPGFTRLRITIGRFRPRINLTDGQVATVSLSGQLVAGSNTVTLALNGHAPATGFVLLQAASSTTIACPEDATRTIFAGGISDFAACRQFSGNQASCDVAYHITFLGEPASCFWDAANSECVGCGPGGGRGVSLGCTNTCLPAPVDPCTSPGTIPAGGGIVEGTLTGSGGTTNGTCDTTNGPEAAFAWTPNFSGGARITTCGDTDFANAVYVREATCSSGTELACNQGFCSNGGRVELNVTSGTTYYIFVDGNFGASGNFQLSVNGPITCPSDPTRVFTGGPFNGPCRKFDGAETACNGAFHTSFFGTPASCFYDTGTNDCYGCAGPSEDFRSVNCTNTCLPAPACPDDATRTTFVGGPFAGACGDIGTDQTTCEDAFHLTFGYQPATCYFASGFCQGCGPNNENVANCTDTCLTATDPCTSATVIPAAGGVFTGTTSGKGSETAASAAFPCGNATGPEKVFEWTPSTSGTATIDTCGGTTDFDTILYMREASCSAGTENACNDFSCQNGLGDNESSRITPTVTAGTTYYIFVDGNFGSAGNFTLRVTAPE